MTCCNATTRGIYPGQGEYPTESTRTPPHGGRGRPPPPLAGPRGPGARDAHPAAAKPGHLPAASNPTRRHHCAVAHPIGADRPSRGAACAQIGRRPGRTAIATTACSRPARPCVQPPPRMGGMRPTIRAPPMSPQRPWPHRPRTLAPRPAISGSRCWRGCSSRFRWSAPTTGRTCMPALRQVSVEKLRDDIFVKVLHVQSALAHPPAKVNKAAEVSFLGR